MELRDKLLDIVRKETGKTSADFWSFKANSANLNSDRIGFRSVTGNTAMQKGRFTTLKEM